MVLQNGRSATERPVSAEALQCDHGLRRQAIVQSLLDDIFMGRLQAGQHLVTDALARRFGVSHTPIREALIALEGVGIIRVQPNRGAVVRRVSAKEVREVCQVRRALECEAVRRACGRIPVAELDRLASEIRRLSKAPARSATRFLERARATDSRLHDLIADWCANEFLACELNRLKILFRAFRDVSYVRHGERNDLQRLAEEAGEHLAIVTALRSNDRREAVRAMARHIRSGVVYWTRSLPESVPEKEVGRRSRRRGPGGGAREGGAPGRGVGGAGNDRERKSGIEFD